MRSILTNSMFILALSFTSTLCLASSLAINIDSPTKSYQNHSLFRLEVSLENPGEKSFVVFPAYIRREYKPLDGQKARYTPHPGPVIDPWLSAIVLEPGQIKTLTFTGMQDGDGVWDLEYGRYQLYVELFVPPNNYDFPSPHKNFDGLDIWIGTIMSESIAIHYVNTE